MLGLEIRPPEELATFKPLRAPKQSKACKEALALFRSTKGASKQRRDLINNEIGNLRDLLPLPESARQRLSQLQIMSLACVYIRKCNYFARLFGNPSLNSETPFEFAQSMNGFLLTTTREGKLLYISENVTEYLGHSMVDMMTQGDCLYDIIDKRDHAAVQAQLLQTPFSAAGTAPGISEEKTFFCRMNVSRSFRRQAGFGDHKVMHVRGHFVTPMIRDHFGNQPVFTAICSPLITPDVKDTIIQNNTMVFTSVHGLDMKVMEMAPNGEHHLGYKDDEVRGMSWYEMLHPEDLAEAKEKHVQLIKSSHEMGCMLTVRLMTKFGDWVWVNIVMHIRQPFLCGSDGTGASSDPAIVCINHVIQEPEAASFKLQSQLYSSHIARSPEIFSNQAGSPQHTITQVPSSGDRDGGYMAGGDETTYKGEVRIAIMNASQVSGAGGTTAALDQMRTTFKTSGSTSDSSAGSPEVSVQDQRQLLRADIFNRLKRKLSEPKSELPATPAKVARMPVSAGSRGGSPIHQRQSDDDLAYLADVSFDAGVGSASLEDSVFAIQGLGPAVSAPPPYVQLKHDLQLNHKESLLEPLTPLSQLSDPCSPADSACSLDSLTVDVSDAAIVPYTFLTPASSPAYSTQQALSPPSLADIENTSFFEEMRQIKPVETIKVEVKEEPKSAFLPEIDVLSLVQFLGNIEDPLEPKIPPFLLDPEIKQELKEEDEDEEGKSPCVEEILAACEDHNLAQSLASSLMDMVRMMDTTLPSEDEDVTATAGADQRDLYNNNLSPSDGDLLLEFDQLNQLAAIHASSYGAEDVVGSLFNSTL